MIEKILNYSIIPLLRGKFGEAQMVFYFIVSYLIGSIMFGHLYGKIFYHEDIRLQGSKNVGARNAGRLYGRKAFLIVFLGDALKGVFVLLVACFFHLSESIQLIGLGLVMIGHIKPVTLRFKGGKGISTFIGGMVFFEPLLISVILLAFILIFPLTKSFTFAGLGAFLFIPVFLFFRQYDWLSCIIVLGIIVIIFLSHSENIKERLKNIGRKT
jgi:acyl phosphate:glycerol-3-phosphate acyltransferase